jgi:hypothetical protein
MKKLILFIVASMTFIGCFRGDNSTSAQAVRPATQGWTKILDSSSGLMTSTTDTIDFEIPLRNGALVLWVQPDTTGGGANQSDSCATVSLVAWNEFENNWGIPYDGITKLDTIARSVINVGPSDLGVYIPLADFTTKQWAWASKHGVIISWGAGDKLKMSLYIGGQ